MTTSRKDRFKLLFYWGDFKTWLSIYNSNYSELTCKEREALANHKVSLYQNTSSTTVKTSSVPGAYDVSVEKYYSSVIPKYFFVAISNCDDLNDERDTSLDVLYSQGAVDVTINFEMTNGESLNKKHFSADEVGIYGLAITFFVVQNAILFGTAVVWVALKSRRKLHVTVKIFVVSILAKWLAFLLSLTYYSNFATNGESNDGILVASDVFSAMADSTLVLLLICLAKGWTVVRRKVSIGGRIKISCFITVYFASTLTMVAWKHISRNMATELYHYESRAGVMYVLARVFALLWFWYSARTTQNHFSRKRRFYKKFVLIFSCWIATTPLAIYICSFAPDWSRIRIVYACDVAIFASGQILMLVLYNPLTSFNQSFPFHAMTTAMVPLVSTPRANPARHLGSDTIRTNSGRPSKIVINNPFEREHVAKLRLIDGVISENVRALQMQQAELRRVLNNLDEGDRSDFYNNAERNSGLDCNRHPPLSHSRLRNGNGYTNVPSGTEKHPATNALWETTPGPSFEQNLSPDGKESFDKWWDNIHNQKPRNNSEGLAPPTFANRKAPEIEMQSRMGDAPAPSPDPMAPTTTRYNLNRHKNSCNGTDTQERVDSAGMDELKRKMLLVESEFDPSKEADLPTVRTPNVKTVSVASVAVSDNIRRKISKLSENKKEEDRPVAIVTGLTEALDSSDAKGSGVTSETPARKKKKKKEKVRRASKGILPPPGIAAPAKGTGEENRIDNDMAADETGNAVDESAFLTWDEEPGRRRTDTPTAHLEAEVKTDSGRGWGKNEKSFLGDSGE